MLKAVIFDFNGVMVRDLHLHEEAYLLAAQEMGLSLSPEVVHRYISLAPVKKRRLYFGEISDAMWSEILRRKEAHYFRLVEGTDILSPEVREILPELAQKYRLAIVSNTTRPCFERIFPPELARLFEVTLFADEVEDPKPSPRPLRRVMRTLEIGSTECCYVGDSVLDVQMAKSAGVPVIGVSTGDNAPHELRAAGADAVIGSLWDLPRRLELLSASRPAEEVR